MMSTTTNTNETIPPPLASADDKFSSPAAFISSLKSFEVITNIGKKKLTRNVIVAFNTNLFIATCSPASPMYKPHLCNNYDELSGLIFKEGEVWKDRKLVDDVISLIAKRQGWTPKKDKKTIKCNRCGEPTTVRNYTQGNLQCGCTWIVNLTPLVSNSVVLISKTSGLPKTQYYAQWDEPVAIAKDTCTTHGGLCQPGPQNKVATSQRSGEYVRKTPINSIFNLCNLYEQTGKLPPTIIKAVLKQVLPKHKLITKNDVFDWRARIEKLMPTYRKSNGEYEAFKEVANASNMLDGIDNEVTLNDDEAYTLAHNLWLEVSNDVKTRGEAIFSFIDYLELIKSRAKGFTYKLAEAEEEDNQDQRNTEEKKKKKLEGVLWMTATMRKNFELFGDYLCFDMMKRGLNTLLWPYCAVTMFNEMNKMCIACEGILCGERDDMYSFTANFLKEKAPGRPLSSVNIVSGDGFFDQDVVIAFGFTNAIFFTDQWHLLDSGLCKKFGKPGYALLKGHLSNMVKASSEEEFNANLQGARELVLSQPQVNGQLLADLDDFASLKTTYASYCHAQVPGNRGHHGNGISESNHSSVLVYLNGGEKNGNNFCEHAIVMIRELLNRQQMHVEQTNQLLFGHTTKMNTEKARLEGEPATPENVELIKAVSVLNMPAYERFKARLNRTKFYRLDTSFLNTSTQETCHAVFSTQYPDAAPRLFANADSRCICKDRLEHEDMCPHEILEKGGFQASLFQPKHMARSVVSGSVEGWVEEEQSLEHSSIDHLIGNNVPEHIDDETEVGGIMGSADTVPPSAAQLQPTRPVGYVAKAASKVEALPSRRIQSVLSSVVGAYGSCGEERKFQISDLVLKLEKLMHQENTQSQRVESESTEYAIDAPAKQCIASQSKKRMQPKRERHGKKFKLSLQKQGVGQVIQVNDQCSIHVNAKSVNHCSFCDSTVHKVTKCDKKNEMISKVGEEYALTTVKAEVETTLRARLKSLQLCSDECGKGVVFSSVSRSYDNCNFIIHSASLAMGGMPGNIDDMIFCISFIGKFGIVTKGCQFTEKIWVTGSVMNALLTHKFKKKKYVYVERSGGGAGVAEGTQMTAV